MPSSVAVCVCCARVHVCVYACVRAIACVRALLWACESYHIIVALSLPVALSPDAGCLRARGCAYVHWCIRCARVLVCMCVCVCLCVRVRVLCGCIVRGRVLRSVCECVCRLLRVAVGARARARARAYLCVCANACAWSRRRVWSFYSCELRAGRWTNIACVAQGIASQIKGAMEKKFDGMYVCVCVARAGAHDGCRARTPQVQRARVAV